jgi:nitrate/TMAO reductase-like tetraheme cytochrome c subunit
MKTKLLLLVSFYLLFSCATKSVVADNSKSATQAEIKVAQEIVSVENTAVPETKPAASKVTMLTKELYESKNLYENSCSKCHRLYSPSEFSKEEWPRILHRMQRKAKLDDPQIAGIQNYINSLI